MKFEIVVLSCLIIVLLIIIYFKKSPTKYTTVKIKDTEIRAEIADTFTKRTKGLMFRKSLPENEGMLFVFDNEDYHSFWMMNMSIPIDIIWINEKKEVVDILQNVQPCGLSCSSYKPKEKAMYVLEVSVNFTDRHNIEIGTILEFEL